MQEELNQRYQQHRCVIGKNARVVIKMEPKSLAVTVPLDWEINKIKCLLCTTIPKLEFGMVRFQHDGEDLAGTLTLQEVLSRDRDEECMAQEEFSLTFVRTENKPLQFEKYYAGKMMFLFDSLKHSPCQPFLHPKYYALQTELIQMKEPSGQNLRLNLQSLLNLKNLLNLNRNNNNNAGNGANPGNANNAAGNEEAQNVEGIGIMGPRPGNNRNIFERGGFIIFKILQVLLLWQIIQIIFDNISTAHIFILVAIVLVYFCIEHFQKARNNDNNQPVPNNQPNPNPNPNNPDQPEQRGDNEQPRNPQQNANQQKISQNKAEKSQQQAADKQIAKQSQKQQGRFMPHWLLRSLKFFCLLLESMLSFLMSLFPNWTIQLHFNLFREKFNKIDQLLEGWRQQKIDSKESPLDSAQVLQEKEQEVKMQEQA